MYEFHSMICWYVPFPLKAVEYISDPIGLPRWSAPAQDVSYHVRSVARPQQPKHAPCGSSSPPESPAWICRLSSSRTSEDLR